MLSNKKKQSKNKTTANERNQITHIPKYLDRHQVRQTTSFPSANQHHSNHSISRNQDPTGCVRRPEGIPTRASHPLATSLLLRQWPSSPTSHPCSSPASQPSSKAVGMEERCCCCCYYCMWGRASISKPVSTSATTDVETPHPVVIIDKSQVSPNGPASSLLENPEPNGAEPRRRRRRQTETPPGTSKLASPSLARTASRMARMYSPCHAMPCCTASFSSPRVQTESIKVTVARQMASCSLAPKPSPVSTRPRWGCERSGD